MARKKKNRKIHTSHGMTKARRAAKPVKAERTRAKVSSKPARGPRAVARRSARGRKAGEPKVAAGSRRAVTASGGAGRSRRSAASLFAEGVERAMQGYVFDAVTLFRDVVEADPKGPLADDALFNIGSAYLRMRLVVDAEKVFTELVEKFPNATIDSVYNGNEHGRTAAKALLGRMEARLAQGDVEGARADRQALAAYEDSWATDPSGRRRSFHELAIAMMP